MKSRELVAVLEAIRLKSPDGLLRASAVVKEAKHPNHKLHKEFIWDDAKAGHMHRLAQARMLIVKVKLINPEDVSRTPVPAFVSLMDDRQKKDGGYRATADVMDSEELSAELRETALKEIHAWMKRYRCLTELVGSVADAVGAEVPA